MRVGLGVGKREGKNVGFILGTELGINVGETLGRLDGIAVGKKVGFNVGTAVGVAKHTVDPARQNVPEAHKKQTDAAAAAV